MSYTLIECDTITELETKVNRYKGIGWYCVGGPFAERIGVSGPIKWYQAVDSDKPVGNAGWSIKANMSRDGSRKKWTRREKNASNSNQGE